MRLLITDLDNTLYDWVSFFAPAFDAMALATAEVLEMSLEDVLDEFKQVHQWLGDSEYPLAVLELPTVRARYGHLPTSQILKVLESPLVTFDRVRSERLRLYPGVMKTLQRIVQAGVLVVGHTEAIAETAYGRLRTLGLNNLFHHLYALEHGKGPRISHSVWDRPPVPFLTVVPRRERKPNPALLLDICAREGISPEDAVYVGDSLARDVAMAKEAGVTAVWARYGTVYDRLLWDVLVRVTHWTKEDLVRESRLRKASEGVAPNYVIDRFDELLALAPSSVAGQ